MDFSGDLRLLWLILLNATVLFCVFRFVRRFTEDPLQRLLDTLLGWYFVQYTSIGLPGMLHLLYPISMTLTALMLSGGLLLISRQRPALQPNLPHAERFTCFLAAIFIAAFIVSVIHVLDWLPLIDTDAMTYHAPAAVQWLQTHRLGLFPTWFFNPANTFSPLAGSTFIAWAIAPLGNDTLARFAQAPAIFMIGIAVLQLGRALGAKPLAAALLAIAAACCRLCTSEISAPRDDLFLAAFILTALAACTTDRLRDPIGPLRLGLALGLALATKYTALISVPLLLLMIDAPSKAPWRYRQWVIFLIATLLIAGPWYLRNLFLTGNPLYPLQLQFFGHTFLNGLFVTQRSQRLHSLSGVYEIFIEGYHGLPRQLAPLLLVAYLAALVLGLKRWREPLVRACLLGPPICIALFLTQSPYGEVRFLFPAFFTMLPSIALIRGQGVFRQGLLFILAAALSITSIITSYRSGKLLGEVIGQTVVVVSIAVAWFWIDRRLGGSLRARSYATAVATLVFLSTIFVFWDTYVGTVDYHTPEFWVRDQYYPTLACGWIFVRENIPEDATIAYSQTYLPYPLYGSNLHRRLLYVPVRKDVPDVLHLPHLPSPISGEPVNDAFTAQLNANPDPAIWLQRLKASGAQYLFIDLAGFDPNPPEERFARNAKFLAMYRDPNLAIYKLSW